MYTKLCRYELQVKAFFFFLCVLPSHASFFFLQVLGESLYISGKYLDYEEKYVKATSKVESLSAENESLRGQITTLVNKAQKDKDRLMVLEKSIDIEKAFLKLKDKQIYEALSKVKKVRIEAVEMFKDFDEYLDKLCDYYVEGFELFRKYLAKCHPELKFANPNMEAIEKEVLSDRRSVKGLEMVVRWILLMRLYALTCHLLVCLRRIRAHFFFFQRSFG